jgi:hypothetical protein
MDRGRFSFIELVMEYRKREVRQLVSDVVSLSNHNSIRACVLNHKPHLKRDREVKITPPQLF